MFWNQKLNKIFVVLMSFIVTCWWWCTPLWMESHLSHRWYFNEFTDIHKYAEKDDRERESAREIRECALHEVVYDRKIPRSDIRRLWWHLFSAILLDFHLLSSCLLQFMLRNDLFSHSELHYWMNSMIKIIHNVSLTDGADTLIFIIVLWFSLKFKQPITVDNNLMFIDRDPCGLCQTFDEPMNKTKFRKCL